MNPIEKARSRLTADWQPLSAIKLHPSAGAQGFADLVWAGVAECKRLDITPLVNNSITRGQRTFYRLKP